MLFSLNATLDKILWQDHGRKLPFYVRIPIKEVIGWKIRLAK